MDHNDPKKHSDHPAMAKPGQSTDAPHQPAQPSQVPPSSAKKNDPASKTAHSGHDDKMTHGPSSGGPGTAGAKHAPGAGGSPSDQHGDSGGDEQGQGHSKKMGHGDQHPSGPAGPKPTEPGQQHRSDTHNQGPQSEHGGKRH
jgi:hypothetical protein